MKIAVIGAGAMGCFYGAWLGALHDVFYIDAYQPQVDALNRDGITIVEGETERRYPARAYMSGSADERADLVILFVKTLYTERALTRNQNIIGKDTALLTLQNGAGNDRTIRTHMDEANLLIGTSKHNCVNLGGGVIRHSGSGETVIGSLSGNCALAERIQAVLEEGGFETQVSDNIQRIIWTKLFVNLSINALTALMDAQIGLVLDNAYAKDIATQIVREAVAVAEADGNAFDEHEILDMVFAIARECAEGHASMCQDMQNRRLTEVDAINGAVARAAEEYGLSAPYNAMITKLVHCRELLYT